MSYHLKNFLKSQLSYEKPAYIYLLHLIKNSKDKKLSKAIFSELGDIEKLTQKISKYLAKYREIVDLNVELVPDASSLILNPLKSIQVSNFRGFSSLNNSDNGTFIPFTKGINVFFAPNGGGKTSLCEAIEYSLTGKLKEADRRNTTTAKYIKNGGGHKLNCILDSLENVPTSEFWNSCFIDRNRLQEFSLLGSKDTNVKQSDVLAVLFELGEIDEIVNGMVKPSSFKSKEFLKTAGQTKKHNSLLKLAAMKQNRVTKIEEISRVKQFYACKLGLSKYDQTSIDMRVLYFEKLKHGLTAATQKFESKEEILLIDKLDSYIRLLNFLESRVTSKKSVLASNAGKVKYKDLYKALESFGDLSQLKSCPSCDTPIINVTKHPSKVIEEELPKLVFLDEVKTSLESLESSIEATINSSFTYIEKCQDIYSSRFTQSLNQLLLSIISSKEIDSNLHRTNLILLREHVVEIQKINADIKSKNLKIDSQSTRLKVLNNKVGELNELSTSCAVYEKEITEKKKSLKELEQEIIRTISELNISKIEVQQDSIFNDFALELEVNYTKLYEELSSYKNTVELNNISGIESSTLDYYKQINKHDMPSETVSEIKFNKSSGNYRITLKMLDGSESDAFCILSEGYLRVLGLSLLLSVAKKNGHPIIVFDDVVNAIDSEHRSNIIDMFSNDEYLKNIQRIITTHDRLFWERICNKHKRMTNADTFSSNVLKSSANGIVLQCFDVSFSEKIKQALEVFDIRQALVYSRVWFETLVSNYCIEKEVQITSKFTSRQLKKGNLLEISLEQTYAQVALTLDGNVEVFNFLKNDLINWGAQNQEHHAYDEYNYNFSHSTTSVEVLEIYEKLWVFEGQINPSETISKLEKEKALLTVKRDKVSTQLGNPGYVAGAPADIVKRSRDALEKFSLDLTLVERILIQIQ